MLKFSTHNVCIGIYCFTITWFVFSGVHMSLLCKEKNFIILVNVGVSGFKHANTNTNTKTRWPLRYCKYMSTKRNPIEIHKHKSSDVKNTKETERITVNTLI